MLLVTMNYKIYIALEVFCWFIGNIDNMFCPTEHWNPNINLQHGHTYRGDYKRLWWIIEVILLTNIGGLLLHQNKNKTKKTHIKMSWYYFLFYFCMAYILLSNAFIFSYYFLCILLFCPPKIHISGYWIEDSARMWRMLLLKGAPPMNKLWEYNKHIPKVFTKYTKYLMNMCITS